MARHPNLVEIIDVYEDPVNIYLIQEYLQGGNLLAYIEKHGRITDPDIIRGLLHQLGSALFFLHTFNIVHRDMKPENIMMTGCTLQFPCLKGSKKVEVPELKIGDFGLSIALCRNEFLN